MRTPPAIFCVAGAAFVLVGCATTWLSTLGPATCSLLFVAAGMLMTLSIPFLPVLSPMPIALQRREPWAAVAVACGMMLSYSLAARIMDKSPLNYKDADMLPIMQAMGSRLLAGDWSAVYDTIPGIWSGVQPIYLPFLWMPFATAEIFDFDPRWVTVAGIWVAAGVTILFIDLRRGVMGWLILYLLYQVMRNLHIESSNNVIRLTEEGVVYAWYALLAWALVARNDFLLGLALSLCLLSRFSMAGALPAMLLHRALQGRWRSLLATAAFPALLLVVMLLLFGPRSLNPFTSLPARYIDHARWVWRANPEYMTQGLGLAKFIGPGKAGLQHSILVWTSLLLPSAAAVTAWWFSRRFRLELHNIDLALVSLALTFFHAFIVVPYHYLYFTPVFFGLVVAAIAHSSRSRLV